MEDVPEYSPPKIVSGMRNFLSLPRNFNTDDFAKLVSDDKLERRDYTYGLIFVSFLVGAIFLVWASTLLILKYMGSSVGCASGSISVESSSQQPELYMDETGSVESDLSGSDEFDENDETTVQEDEEVKTKRRKRERRVRVAFLFAAIVTVVCCVLAMIWAFSPTKDALRSSEETIVASQDIVDEVNSSVKIIAVAIDRVYDKLSTASFDFSYYCPNVDPGPVLGADIEGLGKLVKEELKEIENAARNISSANETLNTIQDTLNNAQAALETTDDYLWIIPGVLAAVFTIITVALFGVALAWKERSSHRVQKGMAYGVLPLLILITVVCWAVTLFAGVSAMISGDVCIEGGNPETTIRNVMEEHGWNSNMTAYNFVVSYVNACTGENPTQEIEEIEDDLSEKTKLIWKHISMIDAVGREEVTDLCGQNLDQLLSDARLVANSLTLIRQGLSSVALAVECERIYPIYAEATYDTLCTKAASGAAWGFLLFFVISASLLTAISLRAAFYHGGSEEKVFDESEVAENMVLDEHEDYLNYISKYKHEWQDYNGMSISSEDGLPRVDDNSVYGAPILGLDRYAMDDDEESSETESDSTPESVGIDEISFPSLQAPPGDASQSGNSWLQYDTQTAVAPLLPPVMVAVQESSQNNDDRSDDTVGISLPNSFDDDKELPVEAQLVGVSNAEMSPSDPPLVHACIAERAAPEEAEEEDERKISPTEAIGNTASKEQETAINSDPDGEAKVAPSAPVDQSPYTSADSEEGRDDSNGEEIEIRDVLRESINRDISSENECSRDSQGVAVIPCGHDDNVEMTFETPRAQATFETPRTLSLFEEEAKKSAFSFDLFEQQKEQKVHPPSLPLQPQVASPSHQMGEALPEQQESAASPSPQTDLFEPSQQTREVHNEEQQAPTTPLPPSRLDLTRSAPRRLMSKSRDYRSTTTFSRQPPRTPPPAENSPSNIMTEPPRQSYRSTLWAAERSGCTLSFTVDDEEKSTRGPVAQKVNLFTKKSSEPRNKPPTPGRRPKIKNAMQYFPFFDTE